MFNTARSRNASDCCESILVTTGLRGRSQNPTLAQNARMGHPNFKTQNLNAELQHPKPRHPIHTQTSTPELNTQISTLKFQKPEFKITRKSGLSYRMLHTARSTWPQPLALSSWARRSHSVDTLGWMGAYNSAYPRPIPHGVKLCPTPGNSGRAR